MATITLRSAKGSPLTNNEVDANFSNLNTAKYEANDNISAGTIAGSTLTLTGNATFQGTTTLSASSAVSGAGSTQGAATALTASYNIVTTATAGSAEGVKLPDTATGLETFILNDTAVSIKIYPSTGESIDGGSANASVSLAAGHSLKLVGVSSTKWNRLSPVIIYNSSGTRVN
jgi:hypothetical protein